jgi:hypothetical protein
MAFLVYFFVLLVAAASVMFGLDWTQAPLNPPPYATPPAQTATVTPNPVAKTAAAPAKPAAGSVSVAKTTAATKPAETAQASAPAQTPAAAAVPDQAAQAHASATPADAAPVETTASTPAAAASCNVNACSAAYRSFRAADCTYQPSHGDRRLCTKSAAGKVATAAHPRSVRRTEPRADYRYDDRRYNDRRDSYYDRRDAYDDRRGGWDFFGGGND